MAKEWWQKKREAERKKVLMKTKPKKECMAEQEAKQSKLNFDVFTETEKAQVQLLDKEVKPAKSIETGRYEWQEK